MVEGFQGIHGTTPNFYALECRARIGDMMCNVMPLGFPDVIFLFIKSLGTEIITFETPEAQSRAILSFSTHLLVIKPGVLPFL